MTSTKKKLNVVFRSHANEPEVENEPISALRLVKPLALNYPLLYSWGFRLNSVVAITTPSIGNVLEELSNKGSLVLGQTLHEIKQDLHAVGKTLFLYPNPPSASSDERLAYILSVVKAGMLDNRPFMGVVVIITDRTDLSDPNRDLMLLERNALAEPSFSTSDLVPDENELALVHDTIRRTVPHRQDEFDLLRATACCMFPDMDSRPSLDECFVLVDKLKSENDNLHDSGGLSSAFLQAIFSYAKAVPASFIKLPDLEEDAHSLTTAFFFNDDFLYMSETTFKKVTEEEMSAGSNAFKKALKADHILIPEPGNTKSYAVNMRYTLNGDHQRISMLRFDLEKLTDEEKCLLGDFLAANKEEDYE